MFRLRASRNNDDVFLCQETKQYLCGRFPVLFSKGEHRRLLKHFIDPKVAALKSLKAAKKGRAVYTTGAFYKCYRLLAKLIPHTLLVKFAGLG